MERAGQGGGGGPPYQTDHSPLFFRKIVRIERSPVRVASPAGIFRGRNTSSPKTAGGGGGDTVRAAILVSYGTEEASWKRVIRFDTHPRWTPVVKNPRSRRSAPILDWKIRQTYMTYPSLKFPAGVGDTLYSC